MDSNLFKAAKNGDIEALNKYQGDLHRLVDGRQNTVLHIYCRTGVRQADRNEREFFVKQLVGKCSSLLLQPNDRGEIPLHIAARQGDSAIVKILIKLAKEVQDDEDVEKGLEATTLQQMLRMRDKEGNTAMHKAAESGDLDVVLLLLDNLDADFSFSANTSGKAPLYMAVIAERSELVAKILEKYVSSNYSSIHYYGGPNGRTALHAAVIVDDEKSVRKIIEANKHLTKETDDNGRTPLHYAALYNSCSVAKLLLESDASAAYVTDKERGMTALHWAAWGGMKSLIEDIISYCPGCCEIVDKRGWNFLHFTVLTSSPKELERFLLSDKSEIMDLPIRNLVNEKDVNGITPFHLLMFRRGYIEQAPRGRKYDRAFDFLKRHIFEGYEHHHITVMKERQFRELLKDMANDAEFMGLPIGYHFHMIVNKMEEEEEKRFRMIMKKMEEEEEEIKEQVKPEIQEKAEQVKREIEEKAEQVKREIEEKAEQVKREIEEKAKQGKREIEEKTEQGKREIEEKAEQGKRETEEKAEQGKRETEENAAQVKSEIGQKEQQEEKKMKEQEREEKKKMKEKEKLEVAEKARESHLLVATLVATVTFTAAFTVPGGYHEHQGTATLIRDSAFQAFIISNTLAFFASLFAITFHFFLVMFHGDLKQIVNPSLLRRADQLTVFAIAAMVIGFSTGTYAVLQSSSGIAIAALISGLIFFPISLVLFIFDLMYPLIRRALSRFKND